MNKLIKELLDKEISIDFARAVVENHYLIKLSHWPMGKSLAVTHGWVEGFDKVEGKIRELVKELDEAR